MTNSKLTAKPSTANPNYPAKSFRPEGLGRYTPAAMTVGARVSSRVRRILNS
ncbi:MAG: hypothetical protein U1E10_03180 [Bdellovibrionales bacterium]|nr:hypothetical protein [Bdellovibrionales bacterium]